MPSYSTVGVGFASDDGTGTVWRTSWQRVNTAITGLETHENNVANPHVVTEAQIGVKHEMTVTFTSPSAGDEIKLGFVGRGVTITEMRAVHSGTTVTPSVTWTVRHHTDRSNAGNEVVTSGTTTTSTTVGDDVTSFNDASVPVDSHIWAEITAESGTTDKFEITVIYQAV